MEQKSEYQGELFKELIDPENAPRTQKGASIAKRYSITLNVSYEHIVFLAIAFIMSGVLIFSLGVEKGRHVVESAKFKALSVVEPETVSPAPIMSEPKKEIAAPTELKPSPPLPALPKQPQTVNKVSKPYTIQVATYSSKENAKKELEKIKRKGLEPFIISLDGKYEVCVGEYINKVDGQKDLSKLKKDYKDCFLRKR